MKTIFKFKGDILLEKDGYCPIMFHSDVVIKEVTYFVANVTFKPEENILLVSLNEIKIHFNETN